MVEFSINGILSTLENLAIDHQRKVALLRNRNKVYHFLIIPNAELKVDFREAVDVSIQFYRRAILDRDDPISGLNHDLIEDGYHIVKNGEVKIIYV